MSKKRKISIIADGDYSDYENLDIEVNGGVYDLMKMISNAIDQNEDFKKAIRHVILSRYDDLIYGGSCEKDTEVRCPPES